MAIEQLAPSATGNRAPEPEPTKTPPVSANIKENVLIDPKNPSVTKVTLIGTGGAGLNLARPFKNDPRLFKTVYMDTSMVNSRPGESVYTVGEGNGSGSNRKQNAREIEAEIPHITDADLGVGDVAIVVFSFAGGSGSVLSPLVIRDLHRRGVRVIGIGVVDSSSAVGATNVLNTLKTFTNICKNSEIYLPMMIFSNDLATRTLVDEAVNLALNDLIDILTLPVYEVDRNDRLNWINPTKAITVLPGIKLISFESQRQPKPSKSLVGSDSKEMVDTLLVLLSNHEELDNKPLTPSRLKKVGVYADAKPMLIGKVSSDIREVDKIIDMVERMQGQAGAQKHQAIDRLSTAGGGDDLVL